MRGHGGNFKDDMPPQSLLFPNRDILLAFSKTPLLVTSPSSKLKETFRYSKRAISWMPFGIDPDKLFWDKSRYLRPFNEAKEEGMVS